MGFSEKFLWGVALSGFQLEMGDSEGKNIDANTDWYVWAHDSTNIKSGLISGDLPENGVDYWNRYRKDHRIVKDLGINAYRIGTEWSRIFPDNTYSVEVGVERATDGNIAKIELDNSDLEKLDKIADKGALNHYRTMIEDLRARDFKVFICLNHFTIPLWLHDPITARDTKLRRGPRGWVDESTIVEFTKYAAYMAWKLGDIVDRWVTFNEPTVMIESYSTRLFKNFPPGVDSLEASRKARLHIAIAHARAYDAIKKWDTVKADKDSPSPAEVGLIHVVVPVKPLDSENELDVKAAEHLNQMHNHCLIRALTSGRLDENFSKTKGRKEVKNYVGNRLDWLGVNYYTRWVVTSKASSSRTSVETAVMVPGYGFGCKPNSTSIDGSPTSDFGWEIYPEGMLEVLRLMKDYEKPLYVTENGVADAKDKLRSRFLIEHLKSLDTATNEEKIDVRGYFHWSLMDNYEWAMGFKMKFGLYAVDLKTKERTPRKSATTYKRIIENREITGEIEKKLKRS
jgi:beta-galactosidase